MIISTLTDWLICCISGEYLLALDTHLYTATIFLYCQSLFNYSCLSCNEYLYSFDLQDFHWIFETKEVIVTEHFIAKVLRFSGIMNLKLIANLQNNHFSHLNVIILLCYECQNLFMNIIRKFEETFALYSAVQTFSSQRITLISQLRSM